MATDAKAFVISVADTSIPAYIVYCSAALRRDIRETFASFVAEECLGAPPEPGCWVWEGAIVSYRSFEGDYDVDYAGTWRRATHGEVIEVMAGRAPWPDEDDGEEEDDEDA